ncbi:hypothetical protein HK104_000279 [Borealophlyctis nickersoniae]|nr:hypothetical protein HK104_000279 [Borealophlyctis nickersoniae]
MPTTHLRITITPHRPNSLPGYDGDRRVEWSISEDAVSTSDAQRKTRDALRVLRAFWEEGAPEGLRFGEFARTVLSDGNSDGGNANGGASASAAAGAAAKSVADASSVGTASGSGGEAEIAEAPEAEAGGATQEEQAGEERGEAELELDFVDPLAEKLVKHPNVLPAFLSDLRDWDSFRLLLRRHGGQVPFRNGVRASGPAGDDDQGTSSPGSANGSPVNASNPNVIIANAAAAANQDRTAYILSALAGRERLWQDERASLHAALWTAGEQVRTLITALTEALDRVAAVANQPAGSQQQQPASGTSTSQPTTAADIVESLSRTPPPPITIPSPAILAALESAQLSSGQSTSSPRSQNKKVTWDEVVLRREVLKEGAARGGEAWGQTGTGSGDWRDHEWLKELAAAEDEVSGGAESGGESESGTDGEGESEGESEVEEEDSDVGAVVDGTALNENGNSENVVRDAGTVVPHLAPPPPPVEEPADQGPPGRSAVGDADRPVIPTGGAVLIASGRRKKPSPTSVAPVAAALADSQETQPISPTPSQPDHQQNSAKPTASDVSSPLTNGVPVNGTSPITAAILDSPPPTPTLDTDPSVRPVLLASGRRRSTPTLTPGTASGSDVTSSDTDSTSTPPPVPSTPPSRDITPTTPSSPYASSVSTLVEDVDSVNGSGKGGVLKRVWRRVSKELLKPNGVRKQ